MKANGRSQRSQELNITEHYQRTLRDAGHTIVESLGDALDGIA